MNFQCDLYIYESCEGGCQIHVASTRMINIEDMPTCVKFDGSNFEAYKAAHDTHDAWRAAHGDNPNNWLRLPEQYAGKSFNFTAISDLVRFLQQAQKDGLIFPDYLIPALFDEFYDDAEQMRELRDDAPNAL